ncbi:glycosyltransferase family 39 protein [Actinokineospora alba]|nr:glycosyltransferase family 39 protein [Actinokineospora alba]
MITQLRLSRPVVAALAPAAVYLAVRLTGLLMLAVFAEFHDEKLTDILRAWDGNWYLTIAENGYERVPKEFVDAFGNHTTHTAMAFFPGFPFILRAVAAATGTSQFAAALIVNVVAGIAAAYAIARIGRRLTGGGGLLLVALWAGAPMAITLSMTYTEALFTAFAAWALVSVLERHWVEAGCYAVGAGLIRPTATVIVGVVCLAALLALRTERRWEVVVGGLLAPLGLVGYWGYVAAQTGKLGGWWQIQREGWNSQFDWGVSSFSFATRILADGQVVMDLLIVLILLGAVALTAVSALSGRVPWPLVLYGAGIVAVTIGSDGMMASKPRMLVPAFVLLIPIAVALAGRSRVTKLAWTTTFVLFGSWFSAYSLTAWHYTI